MSEAWFNPNMYGWIPGTCLGVLVGLWGSLAGVLVPQGKARGLVMGLAWGFIGVSALFLGLSIVAFLSGQPYGVWYGLGLAGLIGLFVVTPLARKMPRMYQEAEERRMSARDMPL